MKIGFLLKVVIFPGILCFGHRTLKLGSLFLSSQFLLTFGMEGHVLCLEYSFIVPDVYGLARAASFPVLLHFVFPEAQGLLSSNAIVVYLDYLFIVD